MLNVGVYALSSSNFIGWTALLSGGVNNLVRSFPGTIVGCIVAFVVTFILYGEKKISDYVQKDEVIAFIYPDTQGKDASGQEKKDGAFAVRATISGILRGLIRDGYPVTKGFKIADIDPRESEYENCFTISDKARCIAGGVLEALLHAGILPE